MFFNQFLIKRKEFQIFVASKAVLLCHQFFLPTQPLNLVQSMENTKSSPISSLYGSDAEDWVSCKIGVACIMG
jgi:hypothetical protein